MSEWLQTLIDAQGDFERGLVGTDGTLFDHNDVSFLMMRGLIGEVVEAHEAWVNGDVEELRLEMADIAIFYAATLLHAGISASEIEAGIDQKLKQNAAKYHPDNFQGRTVREGIRESRNKWKSKSLNTQVE